VRQSYSKPKVRRFFETRCIYTFPAAVAPWRNFTRCKIHFASRSLALSYWQRYCTAVEQWPRAKLCGVEHRALPIFGRATIMLGISPHSSYRYFLSTVFNGCSLSPF